MAQLKEGDAVEMEVSDGEILIIGKVIAIEDPVEGVSDEDTDLAVKWVEVHAFHRIWGGSAAQRGEEHVTPTSVLRPVRTGYRHIVEQYG
jgi:antitoxin component of MazEF toxin-antitoxin module